MKRSEPVCWAHMYGTSSTISNLCLVAFKIHAYSTKNDSSYNMIAYLLAYIIYCKIRKGMRLILYEK